MVAFIKAVWVYTNQSNLLAAGVLGDSLGAFRHGVLGEFTWKEKPDSGLDFPAGDGGLLVVVSKAGSLNGDSLEDVVHERVHDAHGLAGDSSVRVNLLQHLVDVDGVGLLPALLSLFAVSGGHFGFSAGLLLSLLGCADLLSRHFDFLLALADERLMMSSRLTTPFILSLVGSMKRINHFRA